MATGLIGWPGKDPEWAKTRYGANDIDIKPPSRGVLEYVTKGMMKGNWDCVDPVNSFITQLAPPA